MIMRGNVNMRIKEPLEQHGEYTIYTNVDRFRNEVLRKAKKRYVYDNHSKIIRVSAGFDIETTRIEDRTYMYHWQFSFNKTVLTGRKWADFAKLVEYLNTWLSWQKAIIIVWVANLGYEFSFICSRFKWNHIFAVDSHEPLKVRTERVEFRECLSISGQGGLMNLSKNYTKTKKAKGDLDFTIPRNSQTPLDKTEREYTWADVEILSEWGTYIFENFCDMSLQIPLTATGIVRSHIKQAAMDSGKYEEIKTAIKALFPQDDRQYNYVMEYLFRGGYTHGCVWYVDIPEDNVIGADYTSSYPAVMLHNSNYQRSPFKETRIETNGRLITDERLKDKDVCFWFIIQLRQIKQTTFHAIESKHKIADMRGAHFDNGRLTRAEFIEVALTEKDYEVYTKFYTWEAITIKQAYIARAGKLPDYVLKPLMHFYEIKSKLKAAGLDKTIEYVNAKAICNSMYGCCVTRLKFTEFKYNPDLKIWEPKENRKGYDELRKNQILSPYWGIQITSNARYNLLMTIWEMDGETSPYDEPQNLYSDTDSMYFKDTPRNRAIIEKYNDEIIKMNVGFPREFWDLGAFDWIDKNEEGEPIVYKFKTLGAKRYLKYHDGIAEVTVAGLPKHALEKLIARTFRTDNECYLLYEDMKKKTGRIGYIDVPELFEAFRDNMFLACDYSEKSRSVYYPSKYDMWDGARSDVVTDLHGNTETMTEITYVTILPTEFKMKMDKVFVALAKKIQDERRLTV